MGYIGSHVVVDLIHKNYLPIIVDNLSNSNQNVLKGIETICGQKVEHANIDLCNEQDTKVFFEKHNDSIGIIHFAALKAVGESVEQPSRYYRNNLVSLLNIIDGMRTHEINHLIFSSSCTVYGNPDVLPVTENSPIKKAASPYGNTKQIGEEIITDFLKSSGDNFKALSLRYFNPVGAHESSEIGELPIGIPNNLLPYITQTAAGVRECLSIFGNDYNTPDGTAIRDYIHVSDLADAHVVALEHILNQDNKKNYDTFNLGTGKGYSVNDVVKSFERSTGQSINYKYASRREGDVPAIYADNTKSTNILGWKPKYELDEMTSSAWKWECKLRNR